MWGGGGARGLCFVFGSLIRVFLQESLLDADHHVAVALGPANSPESAVSIFHPDAG